MTAQVPTANWEIDKIYATETAADAILPDNIIPVGTAFDLHATFSGNGGMWVGLQNLGTAYEVYFSAEGFGGNATEMDWNVVTGNLTPGGSPYDVTLNVGANDLTVGVYNMACMIRFPDFPGMRGFVGDFQLEIYRV